MDIDTFGNPTAPNTGDEFKYWYLADNDSVHYDAGDKFNISSDVTLVAKWDTI